MSDSFGRGTRNRRARGSSRASSARSSAYLDDHLHALPLPHHTLRPVDSRFSLNEQFAATRREYEFGDEDNSSVFDRVTFVSEADPDAEQDKTVTADLGLVGSEAGSEVLVGWSARGISRDYYELLCIPRDGSLSPDIIRNAYYRLFQLLHTDRLSGALRTTAESYFKNVQVAFETLIEPYRRVNYDVLCDVKSDSDGVFVDADDLDDRDGQLTYEEASQDRRLQSCQDRIGAAGDFAVRIDATSLLQQYPRPRRWRGLTPLDITIRQSTTVGIPAVSKMLESSIQSARRVISSGSKSAGKGKRIFCVPPTITVTGSVSGFMNETLLMSAPLMLDHYQPPGPAIHGRRRLMQLADHRFLPLINLKFRQEIFSRDPNTRANGVLPGNSGLPDVVVEAEANFSPEPSFVARAAHCIPIADEEEPIHVELSVQTLRSIRGNTPSVGLALHRRLPRGTAFMAIDGGDWSFLPNETCNHFSEFSKINKGFSGRSPLLQPPTVEIGYTFSSYEMGLRAGRAFTKPAERGVRGMDCDIEDDRGGSWTVSAGGTPSSIAGYLRYGQDLFSSLTEEQTSRLPPGNYSHGLAGIRTEVELSTGKRMDYFLAFRTLKRIGRFSKVGFELGLTPYNLHLSLYWSRLGQRINLPFLIATRSNLNTDVVFWSAFIPFISFAALEFLVWRPRPKGKQRPFQEITKDQLQEYITSRRNEADELTMVLAGAVEQRQLAERQNGGLVVLSAKYGVKDAASVGGWAMEEVADVTIALAALVDDGRLLIPQGLRKSRILGFWDPAPMRTKVLLVRYSNAGKEQTVEVSGRDELRLP